MACVNKSLPGFQDLAIKLGESLAESLVVANKYEIPTLEQAVNIIRGNNILQYKKTVRALQTITSSDPDVLVNNMNKILQKYNNTYYVVKGSRLSENPASIADIEIQQKHLAFIEQLNKEFGNIFTVEKIGATNNGELLTKAKEAINKRLEENGIQGLFKDIAKESPEDFLKFVADQALGRTETGEVIAGASAERETIENYGKDIVDLAKQLYPIANKPNETRAGAKLFSTPNPETKLLVDQYKAENGIEAPIGEKFYSINTEYSKKLADAFNEMEHNPNNPETKASYDALAKETLKQFDTIQNAGYTIELYKGKGEPYTNSTEMINDVTENKHLYVLSSEKEFGQEGEKTNDNPLLVDSGKKDVNGKPLLVNDVFRFVHDFFGHTERGNGFGPVGEENAWDVHARMYSDLARRAMTAETRGQNSWVNFGPHMRNEEGNILAKGQEGFLAPEERPFAEQKTGLLPEEFSQLPEEKGVEREGLKVADGTYSVVVNQDALNDLAEKNKTAPKEYLQKIEESNKQYQDDRGFWTADQRRAFSLANTTRMLQSKFGIQFSFINDPNADYRAKYSNGQVVINEATVYPDTPFHEIVHPFLLVFKNEEPFLYNSLKGDLLTNEEGKKVLEEVKKKYPELNEHDQIDEAIAEYVGRLAGERNLENLQNKPWYQKFIDWLHTTLANMGIYVKDFKLDMSLSDFANLILDPSFVFNLETQTTLNDEGEYYQKSTQQSETDFDNIMDEVLKKLRADTSIPARNEQEKTRKYFSGEQLKSLEANRKDIKALDSFVVSALSQTKKITETFEKFREIYEQKGKKSPEDVKKMTNLLYQMENTVVLYSDLRPLVRSMNDLFPDEADSWGSLVKYLDRQDQLIDGYKKYGIDAVSEWLMPYMKKAINEAKASGKLHLVVSNDTMAKVSNLLKSEGVTDPDVILHEAVKQEIKDTLRLAKDESGFLTNWFSGVLNEKDAISQLVGLALSDEMQKGLKAALHVKEHIKKALKQYRGNVTFATENDEKEFYTKYLRQANSYEYVGLDKDGNEKYENVKRWAFHEEYLWDEFYNAKRTFMEKLGERPSRESPKFQAWEAKRKAWYDQNAKAVTDANGKITYTPAEKYRNGQFQSMMNDPYYKTLYENYKKSNTDLGHMGLKYGIIPQVSKGKNLFSDIRNAKNFKEGLKTAAKNLRKGIGAEEQIYYAENIEGLERKTVPINHVRLLDESDLSFNLADGVSKFVASAEKYKAMRGVEPHVLVLKNFINGNAYLKVDKRQALQNSAKGVNKLKKGSKKLMPIEAKRLNDMLNGFINDVMYGESDEKHIVQLWGSRFVVYDKNDTTNNGKPMKQVVKNFEDLRQLLQKPDLNYSDFKPGEPLEFGNNVVTLSNKDWNLSLNKVGNFAGISTALQSMALNVNSLVMNVGIGNVQSFIEASGGRYFNLKDWSKSQGEYLKAMLSGSFIEDTKGEKQSEISQLLSHYDAIQGEFQDELGRKISAGVANRLLRRDKCFFFQKVGEHQIQSVGMLSALRGQKLKTNSGETISLRDAWVKDADNNLQLRKDIQWTEEDDRAFRDRLSSINKELNGNYSKLDKAKIQRIWWGRALIMFRKHIYNAFKARYGKSQINYERGNVTEGYYRAFGKVALDQLSSYMLNRKFRKLTEDEKYALRRVGADLGTIVAMFTLFKATDDDDDDNGFNDEVAFWSRRMLSDTAQYAPVVGWLELWKMVKDPSASVNTLQKYYDFLSQVITDPDERYEKTGPGYTKGELKWKAKMAKVIPIYRQWVNLQDPEDLLKFYKLNVKSIFNSKSKDQEQKQQELEEKQQELENEFGNQ